LGKLGNISGKDAVRAFEKAGWTFRGQVGSHRILTKASERANLTVPMHSELKAGTLRSLIRTSGLTVDEFLALLSK
jgi:predicted RNA binding protein YcfA (HicA-like mRNA interferase family)